MKLTRGYALRRNPLMLCARVMSPEYSTNLAGQLTYAVTVLLSAVRHARLDRALFAPLLAS